MKDYRPTSLTNDQTVTLDRLETEGKIIVFDSYDNGVDASLVKTKLDAYGIPCFLSGENFTGLYPFRNELLTGVQLHIFEKDLERVKEIMEEESN